MRSGWLLALLASLMAVSCWSAFAEGSALNRAQILSAIPDFEEKDRIKDEVAKEMTEYLYSFFKSSARQLARQPPFPGTNDYASLISSLASSPSSSDSGSVGSSTSGSSSSSPSPLASEAVARYYMKKSLSENSKQIRFHQCYFNPISCFR